MCKDEGAALLSCPYFGMQKMPGVFFLFPANFAFSAASDVATEMASQGLMLKMSCCWTRCSWRLRYLRPVSYIRPEASSFPKEGFVGLTVLSGMRMILIHARHVNLKVRLSQDTVLFAERKTLSECRARFAIWMCIRQVGLDEDKGSAVILHRPLPNDAAHCLQTAHLDLP